MRRPLGGRLACEQARLSTRPLPAEPDSAPASPSGMVPLDPAVAAGIAGSDELFGPTAMLLVAFSEAEEAGAASLLQALGAADHVRLVSASAVTLAGTLQDALEGTEAPITPSPLPDGTPRVVFLSGFYSAEVVDLIGAWREDSPLPEPVWAAAVPNNYTGRTVGELVEAVAADDAEMQARRKGGGE